MDTVATTVDASGGILVGHDGSDASAQAVTWAAKLAGRLGCPVHIVRTWSMSSAPRPANWTTGYVPSLSEFESAVLQRLERDVAGLHLPDDLDVRCHVIHGAAGRRLVESSAGVEMLVVATRGIGGFRGLVLGSTAGQIVGNAHCPVAVVPAESLDQPAEPDAGLQRQ